MLQGIIPILFVPFDSTGQIQREDLRRVTRFELEDGPHALGINGFASEAYKMSDAERFYAAEIVLSEVAGQVPVIIGIAPGSLEIALQQAEDYARLQPAALMTLPPATMQNDESALVEFYIQLGRASQVPIMVQQSPHYPGFSGTRLSVESLAQIAAGSSTVQYFKIEGPGSAERIAQLKPLVGDHVALFGGVGGIALQEELKAGASGLLPGVGFNEYFLRVWSAWGAGDLAQADALLRQLQPLVEAVSGKGHEFSLHARKYLLHRAGLITHAYVRRPTTQASADELAEIGRLAEVLGLRVAQMWQ